MVVAPCPEQNSSGLAAHLEHVGVTGDRIEAGAGGESGNVVGLAEERDRLTTQGGERGFPFLGRAGPEVDAAEIDVGELHVEDSAASLAIAASFAQR